MFFFYVLDDIVNKYNSIVHRTIKAKPIDVMGDFYAEYNKNPNKKILNLKLVTVLGFKNVKTFLLKNIPQICQEKILLLVKLKIQFLGLMLLVTWMVKKLLEVFMKKNCKKLIKEFRIEKILKRKGDKLYVKWKGYDNRFNSWIDKKYVVASKV